MARPKKEGLDYFPMDVDADTDDKVEYVVAKCGFVAFGVYVKLLMSIYKNGYYVEFGEIQKTVLSRRVYMEQKEIDNILEECLTVGLFDRGLYEEKHILTSASIQKRYLAATDKRKDSTIIDDINLLNKKKPSKTVSSELIRNKLHKNEVSSELIPQKPSGNSEETPQSKVKESKVKESKVDTTTGYAHVRARSIEGTCEESDWQEVAEAYSNNIHPISGEIELGKLQDLNERYGTEWMIAGITEAVESSKGPPSMKYLEAILKRWEREGFKTDNRARSPSKFGEKSVYDEIILGAMELVGNG